MNATKASQLTKPQRRTVYAVLLALAWCVLAFALLGASYHRWVFSTDSRNPASGIATDEIGQPVYLVITQTNIAITGQPLAGPSVTTWDWRPAPLVIIAAILVVASIAMRFSYLRLVNRARIAAHLCDECGYDLTGVPSPKCPECGAERTGSAT